MNKRKKIERHFDSENEFRTSLLISSRIDREELYLFVDDEIYDEKQFFQLSVDKVANAIKNSSTHCIKCFKDQIVKIGSREPFSRVFYDLLRRYCPEIVKISSADVSNALLYRFFHCTWPDEERFHLCRREEEKEVLENTERLSHVKIFGQFATIDVAFVILSFLKYDYTLMTSLGLTSVSWFRLILETWPYVEISPKNIHKIPISVLIKTKKIRFCIHHRYSYYNRYTKRPDVNGFLDHVFNRIDCLRITKLDFRDFSVYVEKKEKLWKAPRKIVFPNCRDLTTGHVDIFWKTFKYFHFPSLRVLDCFFLDLLDEYAWCENIKFSKLNKLVIQMMDLNSKSNSSGENNRLRTHFDLCLSRLYGLKNNLEILHFQFSSPRFKGFKLKEKNLRIHNYHYNYVMKSVRYRFVIELGKIFFQNGAKLKDVGVFIKGNLCNRDEDLERKKESPLRMFNLTTEVVDSLFLLDTVSIQCNPIELNSSSDAFGGLKKLICSEESSVQYRNLSIKLVIPKEDDDFSSWRRIWNWDYFLNALTFIISKRRSFVTEEKGDLIEIEFWINISPKKRRSNRLVAKKKSKKGFHCGYWWRGENQYGSWKRVTIFLGLKGVKKMIDCRVMLQGNKKIDSKKFKLTEAPVAIFSDSKLNNENILEDVERCVSSVLLYYGMFGRINLYDSIFF